MVEHRHGVAGVRGSNPLTPTKNKMIKTQLKTRPKINNVAFDAAVPEFLQRVFQARNINSQNDLSYQLKHLHPPTFSGIEKACARIQQALEKQQKILIVGDFDADGATSTVLAICSLQKMGAKNVAYLVPNRFEFGYGLSKKIVQVAAKDQPDLIITVDNGISSVEGTAYANSLGIDVIITDHHLPPKKLPQAYAIINPNLKNDDFLSKNLAGVGVIFYLMIALRSFLKEQNWFAKRQLSMPNLGKFLDLVALGTVADVVVLDANNRILIEQGLRRIRSGKTRPGILALIDIGRRNLENLQAADLGFAVAPRLNAAGRLEDMSIGIECLLAADKTTAEKFAAELDSINQQRKQIESSMKSEAFNALEQAAEQAATQQMAAVCLYDPSWHQGVIGIVASRIKEQLARPAVIFAEDSEGILKGSARSVTGFHICDAFESLATNNPNLIISFGGHAMAAGLSIAQTNLEQFKLAFNQLVKTSVGSELGTQTIWTDGDLDASLLTLRSAELIQQFGPWGQGFAEPLFEGEFELLDKRIVGGHHLKLKLGSKRQIFDAIAFNNCGENLSPTTRKVRAAYSLDINLFRGKRSLQLMLKYLAPA